MNLNTKILTLIALTISTMCSANGDSLTGAGSTFINPVMTHWTAEFGRLYHTGINYQPIGSGGGINALINRTVDFAGSDAPMNAQELAEAKDQVVHLPVVIGAVVVAYNEPALPNGLKLTGLVVGDIFLGRLTFWDDARIARLNPGVRLPHARIFVAHRSDGSGTSYIFTDYLSKVCPEWKLKIGTGKSVAWAVGMGGKGNAGVAGLLTTRPNSISYLELAYAIQNHIKCAVIQNSKGNFVAPSAESAAWAAEGVKIPPSLCVSITNTPDARGYPISGFSWLIVRFKTGKPVLKKFLNWVVTTGQKDAAPLWYASIPNSLVLREVRYINALK